jgi:hypothetical protein
MCLPSHQEEDFCLKTYGPRSFDLGRMSSSECLSCSLHIPLVLSSAAAICWLLYVEDRFARVANGDVTDVDGTFMTVEGETRMKDEECRRLGCSAQGLLQELRTLAIYKPTPLHATPHSSLHPQSDIPY